MCHGPFIYTGYGQWACESGTSGQNGGVFSPVSIVCNLQLCFNYAPKQMQFDLSANMCFRTVLLPLLFRRLRSPSLIYATIGLHTLPTDKKNWQIDMVVSLHRLFFPLLLIHLFWQLFWPKVLVVDGFNLKHLPRKFINFCSEFPSICWKFEILMAKSEPETTQLPLAWPLSRQLIN